MEELVLFLLTFILLFIFYQIFFIIPNKKKKDNKKELIEIRYLQLKYGLDMNKIEYTQLLQICGIVSCIDISIVVTIVAFIGNFWLKIIVGFVLVFLIIFISYHFVYLFYKKKGMIKDGKHK